MKQHTSGGLIKLLMFLSVAGFIVITLVLILVFKDASYDYLNKSLSSTKISYYKKAKIEAQDRVQKLINFVNIYKKTAKESSRQRVKDNVNFAINIINNIYKQYSNFPKDIILEKIKNRLRDIRFFENKTGYFFVYDLKGKCILLPIKPKLEGRNMIDMQDSKKRYIVKDSISIAKHKGEGFYSWWWYKIGKKKMKKKIGYIKIFKPLGIFVGTARYEEDVLEYIKKDIKTYLNGLDMNDYSYIFAYDFSGNDIINNGKLHKINKWNEIVAGEHIVRSAIKGAQVIPSGFFMTYLTKEKRKRLSYIKLIPEISWVIGANVDTKKADLIYEKEREILKGSLDKTVQRAIFISSFVLAIFIFIFLLISIKIKQLIKQLEYKVRFRTKQLLEQKGVFETLFNKSHDGILLTKHKKIIDCNKSMYSMYGYRKKEDFINIKASSLFPKFQEDGRDSMEKLEEFIEVAREKGFNEFEFLAKRVDGQEFWIDITITKIILDGISIGYFVFKDIDKRKKIEKDFKIQQEKLFFQARHDSLTSLPNRMLLMDRLHQSIKRVDRNGGIFAVVFLDIDNFKMINDVFGHDIGDLLLIEIASILRSFTRITDIVSRFGGDEFVLVLDDLNKIDDSSRILQKIMDRFQEPFILQGNPFDITFSVGVSIYPNSAANEEELLKFADMAMYRAKESGKNRYMYYDESMNTDILKHIKIEQDIKRGIKNDEFILYFQPQYEVGTYKILGFEALVRWQHPQYGLKYPDYFIQIAENSSLIIPLGELISKKAIEQISKWYKEGLNPGIVSINFTSKQLEHKSFFDTLSAYMQEYDCKPRWIEAELIERYVMSDTKKTSKILEKFKELGVDVSIDDFGTGYSSLSYLKHLEISKLKIDKAFIDDISNDKRDRAIAKSIIDLSRGLDLKVLAEGVETKEQYDILKDMGCEIIQGYYFSKPISSDDARNLLLKKR